MDRKALQRLEVLVGKWGLDAHFASMPDAPFSGSAEVRWLLGSTFLVMTTEVSHPQAPDTSSIIAANPDGSYTQHYFDSRGVVRTYAMTFDGTTWTLTRERPDFSPLDFKQRFVGTLEHDGDVIRGHWDADHGQGYVLDFDLIFKRQR